MWKVCIISIDFRIFWALKNPVIRKNPENSHACSLEWHMQASVNQAIIGSDYGLLHVQLQAIMWTTAGLLLILLLWIKFGENWIKIQQFTFLLT